MFIEGPDVSLKGSPTVSPTTAALCVSEPFPPTFHFALHKRCEDFQYSPKEPMNHRHFYNLVDGHFP